MAACVSEKLIVNVNVTEYFRKSVATAVVNQSVDTTEDAVYYVVNLLTRFADSNTFFQEKSEGPRVTPLAKLYARAVQLKSELERRQAMRRLGDVALFVAGLFADSLNNRAVDIDYYIGMGGAAYGYVSESFKSRERDDVYSEVFSELAAKFTAFVDILAEVGEKSNLSSNADLLRIYEIWLKTGSRRAEKKLRGFGICPLDCSPGKRHH
ncbi:MAG: hypothetical protein L0Y43_04505 [Methylococcaceae bacterium]|nr:hypothetical protein [Methylococcaceae bacterium]